MRWLRVSDGGGVHERSRFVEARDRWGQVDAYEQAWLYLGQSMRRGGWFVESEEGWAAVAEDYVRPGSHALVSSMSHNLAAFVESVLAEASQTIPGVVTLVKHVGAAEAARLSESCQLRPIESRPDDTLDAVSEDRLPQIIIRLDAIDFRAGPAGPIALPTSSAYSDFRYQVRRGLRRLKSMNIDWRRVKFCDIPVNDLERLVYQWAERAVGRFRARGWPDIVTPYETLVVPNVVVIRRALLDQDHASGQVILIDGKPSAIWIAEDNGRGAVGIYCLLADTLWHNLAYLNLACAMHQARQQGARFLLLGGSELESLFRFKKVPSTSETFLFHLRRVVDLRSPDSEHMP